MGKDTAQGAQTPSRMHFMWSSHQYVPFRLPFGKMYGHLQQTTDWDPYSQQRQYVYQSKVESLENIALSSGSLTTDM